MKIATAFAFVLVVATASAALVLWRLGRQNAG